MNRILLWLTFICLFTMSSCSEEGPHKNNILQFSATIDNVPTNPKSSSIAKGRGILEYNKSAQELKYNITYQNVTPTAVTINVGENVVYSLAINPAGNQAIGTISQISGDSQAALLNGSMYINVISAQYPGGEIRGEITINEN